MRSLYDNKTGGAQLGIGAFIIIGLLIWFLSGSSTSTGQVGQSAEELGSVTGAVTGFLSNGLTNTSGLTQVTSEDYINDAKDEMKIYSKDSNIDDTLGYAWNITIERQYISEDANVKVTCSAPDKELAGVTQQNLFQKTGGQIDLTFVGGSSTGTHESDTEVYTYVPFSEGDGSQIVEVTALHLDAYHDGMADMDDYFDTTCTIQGDGFSDAVTTRIFAYS